MLWMNQPLVTYRRARRLAAIAQHLLTVRQRSIKNLTHIQRFRQRLRRLLVTYQDYLPPDMAEVISCDFVSLEDPRYVDGTEQRRIDDARRLSDDGLVTYACLSLAEMRLALEALQVLAGRLARLRVEVLGEFQRPRGRGGRPRNQLRAQLARVVREKRSEGLDYQKICRHLDRIQMPLPGTWDWGDSRWESAFRLKSRTVRTYLSGLAKTSP